MESLDRHPPCTIIVGVSGDLLEVARQLGRQGEQIGLLSRNTQLLYRYKELLDECGVRCQAYAMDVTQAQSVLNTLMTLAAWSPRVDRMIYNISVLAAECDSEAGGSELARMMEASFLGFVNCFQLLQPMFKRLGHGHALLMTEAVSPDGGPDAIASVGQASLRIYLKALRNELIGQNISLTEVQLGRVPQGETVRDLTCEEVVAGLFDAIRNRPTELTIGHR